MKVAGIPFDQGDGAHGVISVTAGVLHRTYGGWGGDYSVGKNAPGGVSFHFLVGKLPGQVVQFHDTTTKCWHAGGWPNNFAVGIEFTGTNEDPLTDWQVEQGAKILDAVRAGHGVPLDYYHGPRVRTWRGWLTHASVAGSDHTDMVTQADWQRMLARLNAPTPAPEQKPAPKPRSQEDDPMTMVIAPDGSVWSVGATDRLALKVAPREALDAYELHRSLGYPTFDCRGEGGARTWAYIAATRRVVK